MGDSYPSLDTRSCPECGAPLKRQANPEYYECPACDWWGHETTITEDHDNE